MYRFARIEFKLRIAQSIANAGGGEIEVLVYLPGMEIRGKIASFEGMDASHGPAALSEAERWLDELLGFEGHIEFLERKVQAKERGRKILAGMLGIPVEQLPEEDAPEEQKLEMMDKEFFVRHAEVSLSGGQVRSVEWLAVRYDEVIAMEFRDPRVDLQTPPSEV